MIKRVEFSLNLNDPIEAALYEVLMGPLRHHRAGTLIRQALIAFLLGGKPSQQAPRSAKATPPPQVISEPAETASEDATERILEQSAAMFGF